MNKLHYIIASIISLICLVLMIMHWIWPKIFIDEKVLILLAMAILPWLTPFFKKFKFGPVEGETHERTQGMTNKPQPPKDSSSSNQEQKNGLSADAKKILATLWKYQKQTFEDNKIKRWTFRLFPNATMYPNYLAGLSELLKLGLVSIATENEQCMLTNEGIDFVKKSDEIQSHQDIYKF